LNRSAKELEPTWLPEVSKTTSGTVGSLAVDLTEIESSVTAALSAIAKLDIGAGKVTVITGAPGAGKSSLIYRLLEQYSARGERVGAVLIDPRSSVTGGAVLGDRVRMLGAEANPKVFIRSVAARSGSEGVGIVAPIMAWAILNAGYDHVFIESVGIGQQELDVAKRGEVLALVLGPDSGDWVQFIKSGILDLCNLIAVSKADKGTDKIVAQIEQGVHLQSFRAKPVSVCAVSSVSGNGVASFMAAIDAEHEMLSKEARTQLRTAIARDILVRLVGEQARTEFERKLTKYGQSDWEGQVTEAQQFISTHAGD